MPYKDLEKRQAYLKDYNAKPEVKKRNVIKTRKYQATIKGRTAKLLNGAKCRARDRKKEFSLTNEWLEKKLKKGVCEISGKLFDYKCTKGVGSRTNPFAPSIDCINPHEGYIKSNCQVVLWGINQAKNQMDMKEFKAFIKLTWEGMNETTH